MDKSVNKTLVGEHAYEVTVACAPPFLPISRAAQRRVLSILLIARISEGLRLNLGCLEENSHRPGVDVYAGAEYFDVYLDCR